MMARNKWYLDPLINNNKKNIVKAGPPQKKNSGSAHEDDSESIHWHILNGLFHWLLKAGRDYKNLS